jgi:LacI family transcriptional regulator
VPEDISLIAVGGIVTTQFISPPLTIIYLPLHEMGVEAMRKLIQIRSGKLARIGETIVEHRLILRESTLSNFKK